MNSCSTLGTMSYKKYAKDRNKALKARRKYTSRVASRKMVLVDTKIFYIFTGIILGLILACAFIAIWLKALYSNQITSLKAEVSTLQEENDALKVDIEQFTEEYTQSYTVMVTLLQDIAEVANTLDEENIKLNNECVELQSTIKEYEEREELFDEYEYALIRNDGTRTDITYERLENLESLVEEKNLNKDTIDLVLGLSMTESSGNEDAKNAESTASGLGQILEGTGRYIYETLMGNGKGTYNHSMALDGSLNLEMMTYYLAYLGDKYNNNISLVLNEYRGINDPPYFKKLNKYLARAGTSVSSISIY